MMEKEIIENYWQNYSHDFAGDRRARLIYNLSERFIGDKTLDVGSGSGALIRLINGAVGIDLVENEIVKKGDLLNLRFDSKEFNTVFATEVLEHLNPEDLSKALNEIKRVMKQKGYLIITVPYNEDLKKGSIVCPKCVYEFHLWQHLGSFNENKIRQLIIGNGFKIVDMKVKLFSLYERGWKWRLLAPVIVRLHKEVSKTLFVVAQKV